MTISSIGGASAAAQFQHIQAAQQAESGEIPGKPDHDGDADDATSVSVRNAATTTAPGNFKVQA
jgi:hypothetical protein